MRELKPGKTDPAVTLLMWAHCRVSGPDKALPRTPLSCGHGAREARRRKALLFTRLSGRKLLESLCLQAAQRKR